MDVMGCRYNRPKHKNLFADESAASSPYQGTPICRREYFVTNWWPTVSLGVPLWECIIYYPFMLENERSDHQLSIRFKRHVLESTLTTGTS